MHPEADAKRGDLKSPFPVQHASLSYVTGHMRFPKRQAFFRPNIACTTNQLLRTMEHYNWLTSTPDFVKVLLGLTRMLQERGGTLKSISIHILPK